MVKWKPALLLLAVGIIVCGCTRAEDLRLQREQRAVHASGDILIAAVDSPPAEDNFIEGINLAVEDINGRGGVLGRKIKILYYNDDGDPARARGIAERLAKNIDVVAVVGHVRSVCALPAAIFYEISGMVFISPGATDPELTRYSTTYLFRNTPTLADMCVKMGELGKSRGFKRVLILNERNEHYEKFSRLMCKEAIKNNMKVTIRSFWPTQDNGKALFNHLMKKHSFDAVYIGSSPKTAAKMIRDARLMGMKAPFIGTVSLNSATLTHNGGDAANGTIAVELFDENSRDEVVRGFVERFRSRYGFDPDVFSSQAYDALSVLAQAMEQAGTTAPLEVAGTLRYLKDWHGVVGAYSFTPSGDVTGRQIYFQELRDGKFHFLGR